MYIFSVNIRTDSNVSDKGPRHIPTKDKYQFGRKWPFFWAEVGKKKDVTPPDSRRGPKFWADKKLVPIGMSDTH
jgi:hypothetical protein